MNLYQATSHCRDLMNHYGLVNWTFELSRKKTVLGQCFHHKKRIELSVDFIINNEFDKINDTVRHEIAHALVGPGHGHGLVWKRKAIELGAKPEACSKEANVPGKYQASCGCGKIFHFHRKVRRIYSCKVCNTILKIQGV